MKYIRIKLWICSVFNTLYWYIFHPFQWKRLKRELLHDIYEKVQNNKKDKENLNELQDWVDTLF